MQPLSRRELLRARPRATAPRLPWLSNDSLDRCTRCGDCIDACEEAILVRADGGLPAIDFSLGGCTACGACADACSAGVFDRSQALWPNTLTINENCLTGTGVYCQSCRDGCDQGALVFQLQKPVPLPHINLEACTHCGACISHCPADAINWNPPT